MHGRARKQKCAVVLSLQAMEPPTASSSEVFMQAALEMVRCEIVILLI